MDGEFTVTIMAMQPCTALVAVGSLVLSFPR
jgi:hypothetical protein